MTDPSQEELIAACRSVLSEIGEAITLPEFVKHSGFTKAHIWRHFPTGGWTELRKTAGFGRNPNAPKDFLSDDDLISEFHSVVAEIGHIPTWAVFDSRSKISASSLRRRFGGVQGTLRRYCAWLEQHDPANQLLAELNVQSRHEMPTPPAASVPSEAMRQVSWNKLSGPQFGPPINFRGLRHAPINEQGVVFLFGMVSYELGFIVEAVHASFPDCEAKRCIDRNNQRWQRVRIEFEFLSSNFVQHGHDPSCCDVIVCWEHDWPQCPIEVVELRKVIDELEE